jgi:hypothetical protein
MLYPAELRDRETNDPGSPAGDRDRCLMSHCRSLKEKFHRRDTRYSAGVATGTRSLGTVAVVSDGTRLSVMTK